MKVINYIKDSVSAMTSAVPRRFNQDGWANVWTQIGSRGSRVNSTYYDQIPKVTDAELTSIYRSDGLGRRIVRILPEHAFRGWVHCEEQLEEEFLRLKAKQKITECAIWARLYGGAALMAFVDDGRTFEEPLNLKSVKEVVSFRVYDRTQITWSPTDICADHTSVYFQEPEWISITSLESGEMFRVHRSRVHMFAGEKLSNREKKSNAGWDDSVLQSTYIALRNYGQSMNVTAEILQDFIQRVLAINGVSSMVINGQEDYVAKRVNILDQTAGVANTIILDSQHETYTKHSSNVGGIAELIDRFAEGTSIGSAPMSILFQRPQSGLNTNGNSDIDNWNIQIDAYRKDTGEPAINWVIDLIQAQSSWTNRPKNFEWQFPPLKISDESEIMKNRLTSAQIDQIYVNMGAVDPQEVYAQHYKTGYYETEIAMEEGELKAAQKMNETEDLNAQEIDEIQKEVNPEPAKLTEEEEMNKKSKKVQNAILTKLEKKYVEEGK